MRAAIHFNQNRTVFIHHIFTMNRTVLDSQCICNIISIFDKFRFTYSQFVNGFIIVINVTAFSSFNLVVFPYHGNTVNSIAGNCVYDIFLTVDAFLNYQFIQLVSVNSSQVKHFLDRFNHFMSVGA